MSIRLRLPCEACGRLHVDHGAFKDKPHHTHQCEYCGLVWRPSIENTVGVLFLYEQAKDEAKQPTGIGDSPSVREPPPVEASPSPRERSAVGAKRSLDLLSAASVLASGMDSDDEHGKCGHCTRTRCWCQ